MQVLLQCMLLLQVETWYVDFFCSSFLKHDRLAFKIKVTYQRCLCCQLPVKWGTFSLGNLVVDNLILQDCCLIPESPFYLEGEGGLFEYIEKRLKENGHMVIVVAEGAGQELIAESLRSIDHKDASGNKLLLDVGLWLSQKIKVRFLAKTLALGVANCFRKLFKDPSHEDFEISH